MNIIIILGAIGLVAAGVFYYLSNKKKNADTDSSAVNNNTVDQVNSNNPVNGNTPDWSK